MSSLPRSLVHILQKIRAQMKLKSYKMAVFNISIYSSMHINIKEKDKVLDI